MVRRSVIKVTDANRPQGTLIEITFGPSLPRDGRSLSWAHQAAISIDGESYGGKSSPFWYDGAQFHELLLAAGMQPVRSVIAQLDGCSGGKAGEIVAAAALDRKSCDQLSRSDAVSLLSAARQSARPVNPKRLGGIGDIYTDMYYAVERGTVALGSIAPLAEIPFVIEAWASKQTEEDCKDDLDVSLMINRTPAVDEISAWRNGSKKLVLNGCGLCHSAEKAPRKDGYYITINVITPYCPITSDGKAPDLSNFVNRVMAAVASAMNKAHREAPKDNKLSQKDVVLDNLDDVVADVSGNGEHRFGQRQVLYRIRKIVMEVTGEILTTGNFNGIITDYEEEHGEIPKMYREPRGSIYHPHLKETISHRHACGRKLQTATVELQQIPLYRKGRLLRSTQGSGWFERHDCAPASSKGYTTSAIRDLVDKLAEHDEPVVVICVTDADAYGTMIYQTFQEATKARGARKIKIIHIGLHPWDAVEAGMEIEEVERKAKSASLLPTM